MKTLVELEVQDRAARRITRLLHRSCLPEGKSLETLDQKLLPVFFINARKLVERLLIAKKNLELKKELKKLVKSMLLSLAPWIAPVAQVPSTVA